MKKGGEGKKVIKINFMKFIIVLLIIVAICTYLGINYLNYKKGEDNIYSKIANIFKKPSEEIVEQKSYNEEEIKNLFIKAATLQVNTITASSEYLIQEYGELILEERDPEDLDYVKTDIEYDKFVKQYSDIFSGEALKEIKEIRTKNIDGVLYIKDAGINVYDLIDVNITCIGKTEDGYDKFNGKYKLTTSETVYEYVFSYNFVVKEYKDAKNNKIQKISYFKDESLENLENSLEDYENYEQQNIN